MFRSIYMPEPKLEFGDGGQHIDPRAGLIDYGPLQPMVGDVIRVGVIGTGETIAGFAKFLERCREDIDGKLTKEGKPHPRANLFPPFPGLQNRNPFRCAFSTDDTLQRMIPNGDIRRIAGVAKQKDAVGAAVELFADQMRILLEGSSKPDVIVAALPTELIAKIVNARAGGPSDDGDADRDPLNFRDCHWLPSRDPPAARRSIPRPDSAR